jgi:hypothetical protein
MAGERTRDPEHSMRVIHFAHTPDTHVSRLRTEVMGMRLTGDAHRAAHEPETARERYLAALVRADEGAGITGTHEHLRKLLIAEVRMVVAGLKQLGVNPEEIPAMAHAQNNAPLVHIDVVKMEEERIERIAASRRGAI